MFFATSGVVGVVYGFISPEWPLTQLSVGLTGETRADIELQVTMLSLGRMMVSGAYYICLQYGSEIFPTVIRGQVSEATKLLSSRRYHYHQGVALTEIVGGIAIFTSPLVVYLVSGAFVISMICLLVLYYPVLDIVV